MKKLGFRAYIKPLERYATGLDTIQFHKCCDVAGAGVWTVVTVNDGIFEGEDIIIEQYTGLKDKNGKEIYEGDIVGFYEYHLNEKTGALEPWGQVIYEDRKARFGVWEDSPYSGEEKNFFGLAEGLEVIGNIHENPERLP